ncbi:MAG: divergent polysaccharide deacetylase family protein [Desulfatibacillaceae bacterium]
MLLLVVAVAVAAFLADRWLGRAPVPHKTTKTHKPQKPYNTVRNVPPTTTSFGSRGKAAISRPVYEVYSSSAHDAPARPPLREPLMDAKPRIAIIIDDLGYDRAIGRSLIDLPYDLTFSVLPHSPHGVELADLAHERGREILLHLPMEPREHPRVQAGPGALLASMDTDAMLRTFESNLETVPWVVGVNNHMGSRLTSISTKMNPLFTRLKRDNLFFVDSRTSRATTCRAAARLNRLPFAERDVFLDHREEAGFIRGQMSELVRLAGERGYAVGIGHPHPITVRILSETLPEATGEVEVVPVSRLVKEVG